MSARRTELLERAARDGPAGATAAARVLVGEFDRLIASRACYLDRIGKARALAASGAGGPEALLPTLRDQRDTLEAFMHGLPEGFAAGRDLLLSTVQSLNVGIGAARERGRESALRDEALAELLLHAEVTVQIAFAQIEVARARLRDEVLGARVGAEARAALDALEAFAPRALEFNAFVVGDPRLTRRFEGGSVGVVTARGEYALAGAPFDRGRHCRLASFKASEALDALAARLGVVARGGTPGGCENRGGTVVAWLSVPEENLIRFRE